MFEQNQWHLSGCIYCQLSADFTHCTHVSIVDFEQVNVGWETTQSAKHLLIINQYLIYFI